MKTSDFYFELPERRIARYPADRGTSRLMLLDRAAGTIEHRVSGDLSEILSGRFPERKPLLVFNNSRVRKARLSGRSLVSGKAVEFLLLNRSGSASWRTLTEKSRKKKNGSRYIFGEGPETREAGIVEGPEGQTGFCYLRFDLPIDDAWLDRYGKVPLPPYIKRPADENDGERYQTVYADRNAAADLGQGASAAAPTAGLHFTREMLGRLEEAGVETAFVTLHVGLGTFLPVRTEYIEDHVMHEEAYSIGADTAAAVNRAKAEGRKIIAVGTTSARTLESAYCSGCIAAGEGFTSIFMYPGYNFNLVDGLFTNFHTPGSTLLMLVSAFAGRERILSAYEEAIRKEYMFYSYGDAMLIL